jgi:hypothetical protein
MRRVTIRSRVESGRHRVVESPGGLPHLRWAAGVVLLAIGALGPGAASVVPAHAAPLRSARLPAGHQLAGTNDGTGTNQGNGTQSSLNWAGYGVSGTNFTKVTGSWTAPKATCPSTASQLAAFWVGIDGLAALDPTVEQVGTEADCTKGAPRYSAWYEMFPLATVFLSTSKYPVTPGETIGAQVSASGRAFTLTIGAALGGVLKWHFSTTQTSKVLPLESSAEWIAEAPCTGNPCSIAPLANFGSVGFTGASANGKAITTPGFIDTKLTMTTKGSKVTKAAPSALNPGGTAFKVTWDHT